MDRLSYKHLCCKDQGPAEQQPIFVKYDELYQQLTLSSHAQVSHGTCFDIQYLREQRIEVGSVMILIWTSLIFDDSLLCSHIWSSVSLYMGDCYLCDWQGHLDAPRSLPS